MTSSQTDCHCWMRTAARAATSSATIAPEFVGVGHIRLTAGYGTPCARCTRRVPGLRLEATSAGASSSPHELPEHRRAEPALHHAAEGPRPVLRSVSLSIALGP